MAFFLFIDESGHDRKSSPYEVLAGLVVEDRDVWTLVQALADLEVHHFGMRYSDGIREMKGKKLLKKKTFRQAAVLPPFPPDERREYARQCLASGASAGKLQMTALAQAKLAYVQDALETCGQYHCKALAAIVSSAALRPSSDHLRKDYVYLFERFFYYLEDSSPRASGIVVFDELDKSQSHILLNQMAGYFLKTSKGRMRASQVIPEPFFVHSHLTTGVQVADLIAYILAWGFRAGDSDERRVELGPFVRQACDLRYNTTREIGDNADFKVWGFSIITDLRSRGEQDEH